MFNSKLPIAAAILAVAGLAQAASIEYVGTQDNLETKNDDPTVGWRNTTPAKTLDIDGDNVVGTDGYRLFNLGSNPTYLTATQVAPNANQFSKIDNPNDPSGADIDSRVLHDANAGLGVETAPLLQFVITGAIPVGETLRVGILMDSVGSANGTNSATYTLKQTVGGSATSTTPMLTYQDGSLDVAYFDVTSFSLGDTFVVTSTTSASNTEFSNAFEQVMGIAFDTGVITTEAADPKITSFSVSGNTATITMTGDDSVDYWCASSTDLTGFTTEETALETGTATPIPSPFNTSGGTLTFDVDVTGDSTLFLRIQDADPSS